MHVFFLRVFKESTLVSPYDLAHCQNLSYLTSTKALQEFQNLMAFTLLVFSF